MTLATQKRFLSALTTVTIKPSERLTPDKVGVTELGQQPLRHLLIAQKVWERNDSLVPFPNGASSFSRIYCVFEPKAHPFIRLARKRHNTLRMSLPVALHRVRHALRAESPWQRWRKRFWSIKAQLSFCYNFANPWHANSFLSSFTEYKLQPRTWYTSSVVEVRRREEAIQPIWK